MTPYVIALAALALLLARTARKRPRGNGYQPKTIGKVINAKEDEKGITFTIQLDDTETHGSSLLRHTTEKINAKKQNNRKKEDEQ